MHNEDLQPLPKYALTLQEKKGLQDILLFVKKTIRELDKYYTRYENSKTLEEKQKTCESIRSIFNTFNLHAEKVELFLKRSLLDKLAALFLETSTNKRELIFSEIIEKFNTPIVIDLLHTITSIREDLRSEIITFYECYDWDLTSIMKYSELEFLFCYDWNPNSSIKYTAEDFIEKNYDWDFISTMKEYQDTGIISPEKKSRFMNAEDYFSKRKTVFIEIFGEVHENKKESFLFAIKNFKNSDKQLCADPRWEFLNQGALLEKINEPLLKGFDNIFDILDQKKALWRSLKCFSNSLLDEVKNAFNNNNLAAIEPLGNLISICWSLTEYGFLPVSDTIYYTTPINNNMSIYLFEKWSEQLSKLNGFSIYSLIYYYDQSPNFSQHKATDLRLPQLNELDLMLPLLSRGGCLLDAHSWREEHIKNYHSEIYEYYNAIKEFFSAIQNKDIAKLIEILSHAQTQETLNIFLNTTNENFHNAFQVAKALKNASVFSILVEYSSELTYMTPITQCLLRDYYKNKENRISYNGIPYLDTFFKWSNSAPLPKVGLTSNQETKVEVLENAPSPPQFTN